MPPITDLAFIQIFNLPNVTAVYTSGISGGGAQGLQSTTPPNNAIVYSNSLSLHFHSDTGTPGAAGVTATIIVLPFVNTFKPTARPNSARPVAAPTTSPVTESPATANPSQSPNTRQPTVNPSSRPTNEPTFPTQPVSLPTAGPSDFIIIRYELIQLR